MTSDDGKKGWLVHFMSSHEEINQGGRQAWANEESRQDNNSSHETKREPARGSGFVPEREGGRAISCDWLFARFNAGGNGNGNGDGNATAGRSATLCSGGW